MQLARVKASRAPDQSVVQDVMIEALRRVKAVDFASEGDFMKYLNQVVLNRIRDQADHWKAQKRDVGKEVPLENDRSLRSGNPLDTIGISSGLTPSKIVSRQEELALLERAMDRLGEQSEEYSELIVAVKLEERTYGEIAAETGSTPDAVRMRVNRAEAALAKIYKALDKAR